MLEVILKQDFDQLGYKNTLVKVKPGYARNYLIPKGIAQIANKSTKKDLAEIQKQAQRKEANSVDHANKLKNAIEKLTIIIKAKAGESGKIFGSVNALQISDELKSKNIDIDRRKIHIEGEIKILGEYTASIDIYKDVKATLKFEVVNS